MEMLELAYAAAGRPTLSAEKAKKVAPDFRFEGLRLREVVGWTRLKDLVWLDLGRVSRRTFPADLIERIGGLQRRQTKPSLIFISGRPERPSEHQEMVARLYSSFPHPESVEVDFAGAPDFLSVIAKLRRLQEANSGGESRLQVPNADLRAPSGRLSAEKVRELFGVTLTDLCAWIGRKKAAVSKTPDAPSLQEALRPFATIALIRHRLDSDEAFRAWLNTEHEMLEGKSPLHWITMGKTLEIADFVQDALGAQPS